MFVVNAESDENIGCMADIGDEMTPFATDKQLFDEKVNFKYVLKKRDDVDVRRRVTTMRLRLPPRRRRPKSRPRSKRTKMLAVAKRTPSLARRTRLAGDGRSLCRTSLSRRNLSTPDDAAPAAAAAARCCCHEEKKPKKRDSDESLPPRLLLLLLRPSPPSRRLTSLPA
jgi:hypothetical protein